MKKTPIAVARHQNVAYYLPSNNPLSTNIADHHSHARSCHKYHTRKVS